MKAIFQVAVVAVCISFGSAAYAQQGQDRPPAQRQAPEQGASEAQQVSYTGCLTKGSGSGQYVIADQKSGDRVEFNAPTKIEKYLNQTVRVTGRASTSGERAFEPESLQAVSPSCESAPKQ